MFTALTFRLSEPLSMRHVMSSNELDMAKLVFDVCYATFSEQSRWQSAAFR